MAIEQGFNADQVNLGKDGSSGILLRGAVVSNDGIKIGSIGKPGTLSLARGSDGFVASTLTQFDVNTLDLSSSGGTRRLRLSSLILIFDALAGSGIKLLQVDNDGIITGVAFPDLSVFVPYTGATTNVELGANSLSAGDGVVVGQFGIAGVVSFARASDGVVTSIIDQPDGSTLRITSSGGGAIVEIVSTTLRATLLAGTGTRMVVCDNLGNLSSQAIPGGGGGGTVISVGVNSANGFAGTSSGGANPALTISTTIVGILEGNGTAVAAAAQTGTGAVVRAVSPALTGTPTTTTLTVGLTGTAGLISLARSSDGAISSTIDQSDSNTLKLSSSGGTAVLELVSLILRASVLAGSGTRMVVANAAGEMSTQAIPLGTVTSVSVFTANGVSGSVATSTTTPAITLTLGAITPSSVVASGSITGSNLSGINTGDQNLTPYALINSQTFTGTPSLPTGTTGVTQAPGTNNTTLATTAFVAAAAATAAASGTYTPTITLGTNAASSTAYLNKYTRVGSIVTVYGRALITFTSAINTAFTVSLPIPTVMLDSNTLVGTGSMDENGTGVHIDGALPANTANIRFLASAPASGGFVYYTFQYEIL